MSFLSTFALPPMQSRDNNSGLGSLAVRLDVEPITLVRPMDFGVRGPLLVKAFRLLLE